MAAVVSIFEKAKTRWALLRHDLTIASTALGSILRKPSDLLTVVIAIPLLILASRAWIAGLPDQIVRFQSAGLGLVVAFYSVSILIDRCGYHRTAGVVAAHAQQNEECLAFALPLFGAGVAAGFFLLIVVATDHITVWLAGSVVGSLAGAAWAGISRKVRERRITILNGPESLPGSSLKAAAVLAASGASLGITCAILPVELPVIVFGVAAVAIAASFVLGRVDADVIRFRMTIGHNSWSIIRAHTGHLLAFIVPFSVALTLAPNWAPAAVAALFTALAAAFIAMRVLAYQSFDRRFADWVVTASIGAAALVGLALPPITPLLILGAVVWLVRRATQQAWLIE